MGSLPPQSARFGRRQITSHRLYCRQHRQLPFSSDYLGPPADQFWPGAQRMRSRGSSVSSTLSSSSLSSASSQESIAPLDIAFSQAFSARSHADGGGGDPAILQLSDSTADMIIKDPERDISFPPSTFQTSTTFYATQSSEGRRELSAMPFINRQVTRSTPMFSDFGLRRRSQSSPPPSHYAIGGNAGVPSNTPSAQSQQPSDPAALCGSAAGATSVMILDAQYFF